jgi:hypothetical protein
VRDAATAVGLTVAEFARRYRIGRDKARAMIARGEVIAINTASTLCGKPRWVILPDALDAFERRRQGGQVPALPPRRKRTCAVDYYPD